MAAGQWDFNGEPIIIDENGVLVDGQHRLRALTIANATLDMVVTEGVSATAFKTVDIGKKRTGADALSTFNEKYRKYAPVISAAVHVIICFSQAGVWKNIGNERRPTHGELIDFIQENKGLLRSVEFVMGLSGARSLAPASALAALHYLFGKKDMDLCERFFNKLNTGENMKAGDPILKLRMRLMEMKSAGGVFRAQEVIPIMCLTWQYLREGKEVERLKIHAEYLPTII